EINISDYIFSFIVTFLFVVGAEILFGPVAPYYQFSSPPWVRFTAFVCVAVFLLLRAKTFTCTSSRPAAARTSPRRHLPRAPAPSRDRRAELAVRRRRQPRSVFLPSTPSSAASSPSAP